MFRSSHLNLQPVDFGDEFLNCSTTSTTKTLAGRGPAKRLSRQQRQAAPSGWQSGRAWEISGFLGSPVAKATQICSVFQFHIRFGTSRVTMRFCALHRNLPRIISEFSTRSRRQWSLSASDSRSRKHGIVFATWGRMLNRSNNCPRKTSSVTTGSQAGGSPLGYFDFHGLNVLACRKSAALRVAMVAP